MLAGVAVGVFSDAGSAVAACVRERERVTPNGENTAMYAAVFEEYKRIAEALMPIYRER